jgi:hypothetical protein
MCDTIPHPEPTCSHSDGVRTSLYIRVAAVMV